MIRTGTAGARGFLVGVVAAAIAAGTAAAAVPIFAIPVQARLAPVAGKTAPGQFRGALVRAIADEQPTQTPALPRKGIRWRLSWNVTLPRFGKPATVTLRISSAGSAAGVVRVLSERCMTSARGALTLTTSQATRVARGDAVVTVRAGSASMRGTVRAKRLSSG